MWNKAVRYLRTPRAQRSLLREALIALAVARIAMACLPFKRIAAWLGTPGAQSPETATPEDIQVAKQVGWAVSALARRVPWDGRCLAQALAATAMLRRRGLESTVSFGARPGVAEGFAAHAWLRLGSYVVTGGREHRSFKTFTTFARTHP
jgi:transglutaminase-like putative cysteine protease